MSWKLAQFLAKAAASPVTMLAASSLLLALGVAEVRRAGKSWEAGRQISFSWGSTGEIRRCL